MKILFAAHEHAWGGMLELVRKRLPQHEYVVNGSFEIDSLAGYDVLIPTMSRITPELLATADRLKLIQQCGAGLEGVAIPAANAQGIHVANVPTDACGNADSVAEIGVMLMLMLARRFAESQQFLSQQRMGEPRGASLDGKTVGIIGLGGIGKSIARRLKTFGMNLIGVKQSGQEEARAELGMQWVGTLLIYQNCWQNPILWFWHSLQMRRPKICSQRKPFG